VGKGFTLSKLPWYAQLGIFVAASVGLAAAFYYFYEAPRQVTMATQAAELSGIRDRIRKGQDTARQLPEFRAQVTGLESRLEELKPILPDERDAGDLLRRVQTLATQSNLVIRGFKPEAINVREMHAEWPIGLQLEGSYHNLGQFLDRVSKFPRIINIGAIVMTQKATPSPSATMDITATATTFVLVEQKAEPAAATKKGAKKTAKKAPAKS
jgi:type IV pilus assembly protein PilO